MLWRCEATPSSVVIMFSSVQTILVLKWTYLFLQSFSFQYFFFLTSNLGLSINICFVNYVALFPEQYECVPCLGGHQQCP